MSLLKEEKRVTHDQDEVCLSEELELYPHDDTSRADSFEFIRIRYQINDAPNQSRIIRNAFSQIKAGGWLEVLENTRAGAGDSTCQRSQSTALQIKHQLIEAGFVDVEERVWETSKPRQKASTFSSILLGLCSTILGMSWRCPPPATVIEKDGSTKTAKDIPCFFVIGRKP